MGMDTSPFSPMRGLYEVMSLRHRSTRYLLCTFLPQATDRRACQCARRADRSTSLDPGTPSLGSTRPCPLRSSEEKTPFIGELPPTLNRIVWTGKIHLERLCAGPFKTSSSLAPFGHRSFIIALDFYERTIARATIVRRSYPSYGTTNPPYHLVPTIWEESSRHWLFQFRIASIRQIFFDGRGID